jgi:hypothetical protein
MQIGLPLPTLPKPKAKAEVAEINWANHFPIKSGEWRKVNKLFESTSGTYYRVNFHTDNGVPRSFFVLVIGNQVVDLTVKNSIWDN